MAIKITKGGGDEKPPTNALGLGNALGVQNTSHMTLVKTGKVHKADKEVLSGGQLTKDNAWEPYLFSPDRAGDDKAQVLKPPYEPHTLSDLCYQNNTLGQLITAMEVNIDGSGWSIDRKHSSEDLAGTPDDDPTREALIEWFKEPFPRESFTTIRRNLRRDMEKVGYGFLEVLRSLDGELTFLKRIPVDEMRLVKLDSAAFVEKVVQRNGEEVTVNMMVRERRFAQIQGNNIVYYREFGTSREVDRMTGQWEDSAGTLGAAERGTEVIFFKIHDDSYTAYGVPRWINQIPSILGSRKAEELNLDFFNSGGLPPALVIIQGGSLTTEVRKQLNAYLSGKGSSIHRAGIVEVHATGGSIDSPGSVRVAVERFGSERMQDSMFEQYDARCEERVRGAFRLPPIFMGKSKDYSYATAFASYTVAEAQVFEPERKEFDEIINNTIMRELDPEGDYEFRSMPLMVNDVTTQLAALGAVKDAIESEDFVDAVSEVTGISLKVKDEEVSEPVAEALPDQPEEPDPAVPQAVPTQTQPVATPVRKMDTFEMLELVSRYCASQLTDEVSGYEVGIMRETIKAMSEDERGLFDSYCTLKLMSGVDHDMRGAVELFGAASDIHGC